MLLQGVSSGEPFVNGAQHIFSAGRGPSSIAHARFRIPLQALFKGLGPNYLKVVPSIAIAFATYEEVKELLGAEIRISD